MNSLIHNLKAAVARLREAENEMGGAVGAQNRNKAARMVEQAERAYDDAVEAIRSSLET